MNELVVAEVIRKKHYLPTQVEAIDLIDKEEQALKADIIAALATGSVSLASLAALVAAGSISGFIAVPAIATLYAGIQAWNSRQIQRKVESEEDFLRENPEILEKMLEVKDRLTTDAATLLYRQSYRRYIWGDEDIDVPQIEGNVDRHLLPSRPANQVGVNTKLTAVPVEHTEEVVEPIQPKRSTPIPQSERDSLLQRLKAECPAILFLIRSHPIRMVGVQRSGKTSLAKRIALLRLILIPDHRVIASTPHHETENQYPSVFQVVGVSNGKRDYPAIAREWKGMQQRVEACQIGSTTTIWDEFGLYDKVMEEEQIKSVLTSCLRETMKFGEFPIFILHGETAAFMPGSKGIVTPLLTGTVRVEAIAEPVPDDLGLPTIRPTGKFRVEGLDGSRAEGQIPTWLTEEYLLSLVNIQTPETISTTQCESESPIAMGEESALDSDPEHRGVISGKEVGLQQILPVQKPQGSEKELMVLGTWLEQWIDEHPEVSPANWYTYSNASRKGLKISEFRWLIQTLIEGVGDG